MYPSAELNLLAGRKAELRRSISERRAALVGAAQRAAKPLVWMDRAIGLVRRALPLLSILRTPMALFAAPKSGGKASLAGSLVLWGPLVLRAVRFASSALSSKRNRVAG